MQHGFDLVEVRRVTGCHDRGADLGEEDFGGGEGLGVGSEEAEFGTQVRGNDGLGGGCEKAAVADISGGAQETAIYKIRSSACCKVASSDSSSTTGSPQSGQPWLCAQALAPMSRSACRPLPRMAERKRTVSPSCRKEFGTALVTSSRRPTTPMTGVG